MPNQRERAPFHDGGSLLLPGTPGCRKLSKR